MRCSLIVQQHQGPERRRRASAAAAVAAAVCGRPRQMGAPQDHALPPIVKSALGGGGRWGLGFCEHAAYAAARQPLPHPLFVAYSPRGPVRLLDSLRGPCKPPQEARALLEGLPALAQGLRAAGRLPRRDSAGALAGADRRRPARRHPDRRARRTAHKRRCGACTPPVCRPAANPAARRGVPALRQRPARAAARALPPPRSWRLDLIHVTSPGALPAAPWLYSRLLRVPLVASYHTHVPAYLPRMGLGWLVRLLPPPSCGACPAVPATCCVGWA